MSGHHISSAKFLWGIGVALFVLTFFTVAASWVHFPEPWNIVVAVAIAVVKAAIVAAFFMNLYWDTKFNLMLLVMSVLFFVLLIGITLLDTLYRDNPVPTF
jgi:cytochrome c oxidase subunit 4